MAHRVEDFRIFLENPEKNGAVAPPPPKIFFIVVITRRETEQSWTTRI